MLVERLQDELMISGLPRIVVDLHLVLGELSRVPVVLVVNTSVAFQVAWISAKIALGAMAAAASGIVRVLERNARAHLDAVRTVRDFLDDFQANDWQRLDWRQNEHLKTIHLEYHERDNHHHQDRDLENPQVHQHDVHILAVEPRHHAGKMVRNLVEVAEY